MGEDHGNAMVVVATLDSGGCPAQLAEGMELTAPHSWVCMHPVVGRPLSGKGRIYIHTPFSGPSHLHIQAP